MRSSERVRNALIRFSQRQSFNLILPLIGLIVISVSALIILDLRRTSQEMRQLYAQSVRGLDLIGALQYQAQEARRSMLYLLTTTDKNLQVKYADQSREADARVARLIEQHLKSVGSPLEIQACKRFERDWSQYLSIRDEVIASILEGSVQDAVQQDLFEGVRSFNRVHNDLQEMNQLYRQQAEQQLAVVETLSSRLLLRLIVILCLTPLLVAISVRAVQKDKMLSIVQESEKAMRESEERLNSILQSLNDAVWSMSAMSFDMLYLSPAAETIYGRPVTQFFENPQLWSEILHPEDRVRIETEASTVRQKGSYNLEFRILRPNGEIRWVLDRAHVVRNADGTAIRVDGIVTDITERKRAEEALRQAEEQYRSIFENAVEGIFQSTPDGRFLMANPAMARMLGYDSPEEFIATITDSERQLHAEPERRRKFKQQIEQHGVVHGFEFHLYRKDGSTMWAALYARAVHDEKGLYYEGTVEDVTQRKRMEEQLQEAYRQINDQNRDLEQSNYRLASLLEVSWLMATLHSLDELLQIILEKTTELIPPAKTGTLLLYDPMIDRLVPKATVGIKFDLIQGIRVRPGESFTGRVFAAGRPDISRSPEELASDVTDLSEADQRLLAQAFRELPPRQGSMCAPLIVQGQPIGVMVVSSYSSTDSFTDDHLSFFQVLSNHAAAAIRNVQLYDEVQQYAFQLGQKNRELESFVYTVSHDLRSPLVSLHGLMAMFAKTASSTLDERGKRYLTRLDANVSQMEELIDGLLELSRVGRMAVRVEDLDMSRLVEEVVEQLRPQLEARKVIVIVHPLLPLSASKVQMRQVFSNLIGNAIKFMGDSQERRIEVGGECINGIARFYVRDTGIGIAPMYHEKIFEIFQRLQELEGIKGTGVGLAIVKKIIETAGGTISVESERGKGATFFFTIPNRSQ